MSIDILANHGKEGVARVFVGRTKSGRLVEFAESFHPSLPIEKKWVNIISVMYGCPVRCLMCDAGSLNAGNLSVEDILSQIDILTSRRFKSNKIPVERWKIQFTRVGEPSLNPAVLNVLETLPQIYDAPGIIPSVSTIAPIGSEDFFKKLLSIKNKHYANGHFQLQFSIHTTESKKRDILIPIKKWRLEQISEYGNHFFKNGERKITLNFVLIEGYPVSPKIISDCFDPQKFLVKITPLNPSSAASKSRLLPAFDPFRQDSGAAKKLASEFLEYGFDSIISIGELEENRIGSNCGQMISKGTMFRKTIK